MHRSSFRSRVAGSPYLVWAALFILVPLGMVAYYSFTDQSGAFTLAYMARISDYTGPFLLSIWLGLLATVICLVIAYPLAYLIANSGEKRQRTMMLLMMLPMWMNFLLRTYSWMTILGDNGLINSLVTAIGLDPLKLINTRGAVVLGMVYDFLPYMVLPIYTIMLKIDRSLVEAAQDLGAGRLEVIKNVIFPLSVPGIVSGVTMVFVPSVSTFYISQKLGGTGTLLIGDIIEQQFQLGETSLHVGASLSFVLMILIFVCLTVMNRFSDSDGSVLV